MIKATAFLFLSLVFAFPALAAGKETPPAKAAVEKNAAKDDPASVKPAAEKPAETKPVTSSGEPDISNIQFMENLRKIGATIYYLGESQGLQGWFVVKGREAQTVYTTLDHKAVLTGTLLDANGGNISQKQIHDLSMIRPDMLAMLRTDSKEMEAIASAAPAAESGKIVEDNKNPKNPPSEKLYAELQKAVGLSFGAETAPHLLMAMDVNCPFCHRAFKALQPLVDTGKLRLTMIPIQALGPQSAAMAAIWLAQKDPYEAWKKHIAGDSKALTTGAPDPKLADAVYDNTQLVSKWGIDQIPYLFYRGKNGKVRMIIGEPRDVKNIMDDIAPNKTGTNKTGTE